MAARWPGLQAALLGRGGGSVGVESRGKLLLNEDREIMAFSGGDNFPQLKLWEAGTVLGLALDLEKRLAYFAVDGVWAEPVPLGLKKEGELPYFPAVSGFVCGGQLDFNLGDRPCRPRTRAGGRASRRARAATRPPSRRSMQGTSRRR